MSEPGDRAPRRIASPGAQAVNVVEGESVSPKNGRGEDAPPGVQGVWRAQKSFDRKLGDLEGASPPVVGGRQSRESDKRHAGTVTFEKSDEVVVPEKSAKMWVTPFEPMEERTEAKGSSAARNARPTQSGLRAQTQMQRIRQRAILKASGARVDIQSITPPIITWMDAAVRAPGDQEQALYASDPRWEPGAGNPLAGFCPGGGPNGPSLPECRTILSTLLHELPTNRLSLDGFGAREEQRISYGLPWSRSFRSRLNDSSHLGQNDG
jgi:hypothetical protein